MAVAVQDVEITGLNGRSQDFETDVREKLLMNLQGTRITIPDLQPMISHWPQGIHPEYERLKRYVEDLLTWINSDKNDARLRKLKANDFALFGASWWPFAPYEALEVSTCLAIWLFCWDDETDSIEYSSIIHDWDSAAEFRQKTIEYIRQSLSKNPQPPLSEISTDRVITCFKPVGEALSKAYDEGRINRLLEEILFYLNMCGEEQKFETGERLPTVEEYLRYRPGSGAVKVCLSTIEYAYGITLPEGLSDDEAMRQIWEDASAIVFLTNDLLSLKKEVAQSQVNSLVPLLYLELGSIQKAVDHCTGLIKSAVERVDAAERDILGRYSSDPKLQQDIKKAIDGCKYACRANLNWSLTTGRYRLNCPDMEGGLQITL